MKSLTIIIVALLISLASCEKKNELPAPTQDGENTFGMMVNDTLWLPSVKFDLLSPSSKSVFFITNKSIRIEASNEQSYISFLVNTIGKPGKYPISKILNGMNINNNSDCEERTLFNKSNKCLNSFFLVDSTLSEVNITKFDTIYKITSGTFFLTLVDSKGVKKNHNSREI